MIVSRNLNWKHIVYYSWKSMIYFFILSLVVYVLHEQFDIHSISIPFNAIATLSTALAIYLGFKNNSAYDRWWEVRKIWGLLVNYSRAWGREVFNFALPTDKAFAGELEDWQKRVIYRHIGFVHALRFFLRIRKPYNKNSNELVEDQNQYADVKAFLSPEEFRQFREKNNPPNYLLQLQGDDIRTAFEKGWLSDYRFVKLNETLTEFNNHQGMSERIKNTPLPRPYSYSSRIFVFMHGTLVPFAFIDELGWINILLSLTINFIFLALDQIGERTEDPFENKMEDTPLTNISITIETNLKEMLGEQELPEYTEKFKGVIL